MFPIVDYQVSLEEVIVHVGPAFYKSDRKEKLQKLVAEVDSVQEKRHQKSPESKGRCLKL